jgi:hypothetical protein
MAMAVAITTAAVSLGSVAPAFAAPAPALSPEAEAVVAALRARLQSFGIESSTQQKLIEKFLAGKTIDADNDAQPISTQKQVVDGIEKTRNVYADGSVAIGSVELKETDDQVDDLPNNAAAAGEGFAVAGADSGSSRGFVTAGLKTSDARSGFTLASIKGCTSRVDKHGTHIHDDCEIGWDAATWSVSWTADYDYNGNGAAITSARGVHFGGLGTFSSPVAEIIRLRVDNQGTAKAEGSVIQNIGIAGVSTTRRVGVRLEVSSKQVGGRNAREKPYST